MRYRRPVQLTQSWKRIHSGWIGVVIAALYVFAIASSSSAAAATHKGGTLTIANVSGPDGLNAATANPGGAPYFDLAYQPLIIQEANGSFGPGLATAWKIAPGNRSMTITLRKGVRFSDGTRLTAKVVKTWLFYELKLPGGQAPLEIGALKSVTIHNSLSLTLHFSAPTPNLEAYFSQTYDDGEIGSLKAARGHGLTDSTDGAGEYKLDPSQTVPGSSYTYVPNPYYYDPSAVHWKKVVIKVIATPSTTLAALQTGQVQLALSEPPHRHSRRQKGGAKGHSGSPTGVLTRAV